MKNRVLVLLLGLSLLFGSVVLSACTDKTGGPDTETNATTDDQWLDNLPADLKFNDKVINFIIAEPSKGAGGTFSARSIYADSEGGDNVDVAVHRRNILVEERLGVKINVIDVLDGAVLHSTVMNALAAGSSEYDIISGYQAHDLGIASRGYMINLNDLKSYDADYIDTSKPYWSEDYSKNMAYKSAMYWITGDLSLRYIGGIYCTFVNAALYKSYFQETYGSIYDMVKAGDWTLDRMTSMSEAVFVDRGLVQGVIDAEDQLGFVIEMADPLDGMAVGAGVQWSQTNADGDVSIVFYNTNTLGFVEKMNELLNGKKGAYTATFSHSANMMNMFNEGNVLFVCDKIYQAQNYLGNMEDDYHIIPLPKLDSSQQYYRSAIHDGCSIYGINYMSENIPASAATLEALAAESYKTVSSIYYDIVLKSRYTRDPETAEMVDLIRNSVYTDFAFAWGGSLNSIHNWFRTNITANPTSELVKMQSVWETRLSKLLEGLDKYS